MHQRGAGTDPDSGTVGRATAGLRTSALWDPRVVITTSSFQWPYRIKPQESEARKGSAEGVRMPESGN
jgi:hypothetical protein